MTDAGGLLTHNIEELSGLLGAMHCLESEVEQASGLIQTCFAEGGKLIAFGNGGSAGEASDFCTEFVCRFVSDRRPFPAIEASASGAAMSAISNDFDFDQTFARQVRAFGRAGDVVVGFSTSGESVNIRLGLEAANDLGLGSIAFLGKGGGSCNGLASVSLVVPHQKTARIQEAHKLLMHTICEAVDADLVQQNP